MVRTRLLNNLYFSLIAVFFASMAIAAVPDLDSGLNLDAPSKDASVEELIGEAEMLFAQQKPIQARNRLQLAIEADKSDYRPYMRLCQYYLAQVGDFKNAYRYALTAEKLFMARYGGKDQEIPESFTKFHAALLYFRAETELNLDRYEDSLKTLERFEKRYSADWFPGTKAWVLMKLKRLDEAAVVAQNGLLLGADPRRTYNILGILLSMQNRREQSLIAFAKAITAELSLGSRSQAATPLNNSGEVYRELFKEGLAEAAFIRAQRLSDGCEHVLPSLNLAHLYIDALRLNAAERSLTDFEVCYAKIEQRMDTEHRALIALARGRIQLRAGNVKSSGENLRKAIEREQWFGKIGTNEDDVRLAAYIAIAHFYHAEAAVLRDRAVHTLADKAANLIESKIDELKSEWYFRIARNQAIRDMSDFEDLYVRHTDTQLEYPTLGNMLAGLPSASVKKRIERLKSSDHRAEAKNYYDLYLATTLLSNGKIDEAVSLLDSNNSELRKIDGLARAENLSKLIEAKRKQRGLWSRMFGNNDSDRSLRIILYRLLPSQLRYAGLKLPILSGNDSNSRTQCSELSKFVDFNLGSRFEFTKESPFVFNLTCDRSTNSAKLTLFDNDQGRLLAESTLTLSSPPSDQLGFYDSFVDKVFTFKTDPPAEPLPELEFID